MRDLLYVDPDNLPPSLRVDRPFYERLAATERRTLTQKLNVPIRSGQAWPVRQGQLCRIVALEGPQVCDFNAWNLNNPRERFWCARTRQLQGAHVSSFDRLWSCLPYLRPMLTITNDTLSKEPTALGGRCHDLLGSRCDPYLYKLIDGLDFNLTCHNNLTRAVAPYHLSEWDVHDVLNIFQITGLDPVHEIYFMEASPAKAGDFLEFFAEIDLLCAISSCPGGDLSVARRGPNRGDPLPTCKPLGIEVYDVEPELLEGWRPPEPVNVGSTY
ncbi:MAG: urea carboxylase-associated family protein [Anaerolineales bacterium]